MPPKIIAIEGIDGVGKTFLCQRLLSEFDISKISVVKIPSGIFFEYAKELCGEAGKTIGSLSTYLLADAAIVNQYRYADWIIIDKYVLSTLVYHFDLIETSKHIDFFKILQSACVSGPVYTIYLECNHILIKQRLQKRNKRKSRERTSEYLEEKYSLLSNAPQMRPWIGNMLKMKSETVSDQDDIIEKIRSIISDL